MQGVIASFKGSHKTQYPNQMIIHPEGVENKEDAAKLVGQNVVWTSPAGKELKGEVRAAHGNSGAIRVLFETGMPGQSLGTKVEISK